MKARKSEKSTTPKSTGKRPTKASAELVSTATPVATPNHAPAAIRQAETEPASPAKPDSLLETYTEQLRTGELASRMVAAARLAEIGGPQAAGALRQALRDPTAEVAREAAIALGKARLATAVDALAGVVENADGYFHGAVRTAAAESLAQLNERRAIPALSLAVRDPLAEPSRAAIRALGLVAGEEAVPTLRTVLSNDDNYFLPSVRVAAAEVLATIPTTAAKDFLRSLLENPAEDPEVRQAAMLAFA